MWRNMKANMQNINTAAKSRSLIILNIATTGLGKNAGVIEITARKTAFSKGMFRPYEAMHFYINSGIPVGKSEEIHGLTDAFLKDKPYTGQIKSDIEKFFDEKSWVCSFSDYAVRMLSKSFDGVCEKNNFLDLASIARDAMCCVRMPERSLRVIAARRGLSFRGKTQPGIETNDILLGLLNSFIREMAESAACKTVLPVPKVIQVNFVKGYRSVQDRLYVNLDCGTIYYEQKTDYWGNKDEASGLTGKIDMNAVQEQVIAMTGCLTYKDLQKYKGSAGKAPW